MKVDIRVFSSLLFGSFVGASLLATAQPPTAEREDAALVEYFEKKVRPILANNCYNCHSANTNSKGGLRVDDRQGLLQGGNRGPAVMPGNPQKSLLIQAVAHTAKKGPKMPPGKELAAEDIDVLKTWIRDGAVWPKVELPPNLGKVRARVEKARKEHWAWQPLHDPKTPTVKDEAWPAGDIDRFILAQLEAKGLGPVGDADKRTLLRRVAFALTGLPPTPEEIAAFEEDTSDGAYEKVVDRLLGSAAFGERWGRHWLDVARYGESSGSSRNLPTPHSWRYRDYVIDAFQRDKPYDQFLREQIAGDLLPAASPQERDEHVTATGFLALGVKDVNQRFKVRFIMDNVDEQIDTVTRSILGLTASCARCHDHKFDPIPTTDYYALAGIFTSSDLCAGLRNKMGGGGLDYYDPALLIPLTAGKTPSNPATAAKIAELKKAHEAALAEFERIRGTPEGKKASANGPPNQMVARKKAEAIERQIAELADPSAKGGVAMGVRDAKKIGDTELRVRGEAEKLGPIVPRGFLSLVDVPGAPKVNPAQSGRLELAQWLSSPKNPLTSRVMANRIWHHLFNRGIVATVDNFGVTGDLPSHPELLDHLANRFVNEGWSAKKLIRAIVLSRAYRLGSDATPERLAADPLNRLVWRHSPRRLEAEEIRDAMLAAAGTLDPARPKGSPAQMLKVVELRNNGPEARKIEEAAAASVKRSVYLPLVRGLVPRPLEIFDFAEQGMVTGQRDATTVAPQALYMLNDPFVRKQSLAFAQRLLKEKGDDKSRIRRAYQFAYGRDATPKEVDRAKAFIVEFEALARKGASLAQKSAADPAIESETPKAGPEPANPDEADQTGVPSREETIAIGEPRTAAWTNFTQAIFASAEFRFLK